MLRLRNVGRDSQQTKRCRRGDTVTDTTANIIGVHIFAIDDAALDGIPDPDAYIVSLSGCRQGCLIMLGRLRVATQFVACVLKENIFGCEPFGIVACASLKSLTC